MKKRVQKKKTGFTLIELLVVMTIIIVLASIGLVSYRSASQGARNAKRKSDMETVRQALVLYNQEIGFYPPGGADRNGGPSYSKYANSISRLADEGYVSNPVPIPNSDIYTYTYDSPTGSTFCVCAYLEGSGKGNSVGNQCVFTKSGSETFTHYCAVQP